MIRIVLSLALFSITLDCAACPFCVSEMQTLSEEISSADAVVLGRLQKPALPPDEKPIDGVPYGAVDPETGKAVFAVDDILKGADQLVGVDEVEAIYFGKEDFKASFLLRGIGPPLEWGFPIELSPLAVEYVKQLPTLPESGAERLAFFQPYLEHEDRQLAQDAYDEFARAPMADLHGLANRIDHDRVVELINRPLVSASRRRLFFMMLGVCGAAEDAAMIEAMIEPDAAVLAPVAEAAARLNVLSGGPLADVLAVDVARSQDRRRKAGLDAMIACYVALRGESGLNLVDQRFLANPDADQTHIYSVLMALRYLAEEESGLSRERLLQSARLLLDNKAFADQVVIDLARWDDWSVMPRLAEMFRVAGEPGSEVSKYVRDPIVTYLDIAAEQPGDVGTRANELLDELEPIAPDTFRIMRSMQAFGSLAGARRPSPVDEAPGPDNAGAEQDVLEADGANHGGDDLPPNPADFNADRQASTGDKQPAVGAAEEAEEGAQESPAPVAAEQASVVPAGAKPLTPPSRVALVVVPLVSLAGCFGVLWLILRGGA